MKEEEIKAQWKDEEAEEKHRIAWLEAEYIIAGLGKVEQEGQDVTSKNMETERMG